MNGTHGVGKAGVSDVGHLSVTPQNRKHGRTHAGVSGHPTVVRDHERLAGLEEIRPDDSQILNRVMHILCLCSCQPAPGGEHQSEAEESAHFTQAAESWF
jgi:hypothetical protein